MKVCWSASSASSSLAEHVPAEGQQAAVIAVEDHLEGTLVAGADAGHEGVVGAPARERRRGRGRRGAVRVQWWRTKRPWTRSQHILSNARIRCGLVAGESRSARRLSCATAMPFFRHEGSRLAYTIYGDGSAHVRPGARAAAHAEDAPAARAGPGRARQPRGDARSARPRRSDRPRDMWRYSMPFFGEQVIALLDHLEVDEAVARRPRSAPTRARGRRARARARARHGDRDARARQRAARLRARVHAADDRADRRRARHAPRRARRAAIPTGAGPLLADIGLDCIRQDPAPSAAVLQGLFFGRIAPHALAPRRSRRRRW